RATAFTEYPNLAAAFILYGLQALTGLALAARHAWRLLLPGALLFALGLLFTYSRGALVATAVGLLALAALLLWARRARPARLPLAAAAVLGATAASFAWGGEIFRLRLGSEGTEAFYAVRYQLADTSLRLAPGERRVVKVQVTNLGQKTWAIDEAFHLSYHWYDQQRVKLEEGGRTRLPRDLAHGESALLLAEVRAPRQEGQYLLVWDMVHEHTTWFTGQGVAPAVVPTVVSGSPQPAPPPPAEAVVPDVAWRPGRWELWRLARDMWRERPLLGVGPDNFRWLHGPRAGQALWDSRVFANNLYLEAAATTGTLGLLALLAALGTALVAAARRILAAADLQELAAPAALFAALAAVAAHGMVDYLLAFTGHYLVLGLLVGLAAGGTGSSR
ncbi:MAG TPA: O-antigen ligase family protein, partial [Vicinamibacteria bacterium]